MKLLVLTKRQYMAKDLLDDRFGRFRELPLELARLGHEVVGICHSYRAREEGMTADTDPVSNSCVQWHSLNVGKLLIPGLLKSGLKARQLEREFVPDLVWACSDAFHVIYGVQLAKRLGVPCVVDLYDNFEAFTATRVAGAVPWFKRAVRRADGVTCFSERLADRVLQDYRPHGLITVIQNGVRNDLFYPRDRSECRRKLGLPEDARIVGTAGALYSNRGIETLFRGFELLAAKEDDLHLAIAGPRHKRLRLPTGPRIHDLGVLPWTRVPLLINALDVAVSCYRDSELGRYSFPQKVHEIMACRTPLVAARVGSMQDLLADHPECLFEPENPESLAERIRLQLKKPKVLDIEIPTWADLAKRLEGFFAKVIG